MLLNLTGAARIAGLPSLISVAPIVVRLIGPFATGADRGLSTLVFISPSLPPLTIRRATLALKSELSLGGEPAVAAVGLRRRWVRILLFPVDDEERLSAERIFCAST